MSVYFIIEADTKAGQSHLIKIGRSSSIQRRIRELQTGNPNKLALMGWIDTDNDIKLERKLHRKFHAVRNGGEWFNLDPEQVIEELRFDPYKSWIAISNNTFEIESYDRDGVPEIFGPWHWGDLELGEFCPRCGSGLGASFDERFNGQFCLKCGIIHEYDDLSLADGDV